jgi:hypothetical protein
MRSLCVSGASGAVALLVLAQWGCAGSQASAPAQAPAPARAAPSTPPSTIADASAACDRVQASAEIPVTCTTDYVDDVPAMIVGLRTPEEARSWLGAFAQHIGNPFCDAANRNGRPARVYMTVGTGAEQHVRMFSCELGKWSSWFSTAGEEEEAAPPPQTLSDAIVACKAVQANRDVPVSCRTEYVNDVPAMIVGFPTADAAQSYMDQVAEQIAGPFCSAANRASRRAALFITLANAQARRFDCEQQSWSDWFELEQPAAPNRSSL